MKHIKPLAAALLAAFAATAGGSACAAPDFKVALIAGKTGPLEAYAKETETGFMMGLEYLTGGKMEVNGRKLKVIVKDDQGKPDLGRTLLAEAYGDDKVDLAVGTTSSGSAIAMLPVAKEYRKVLIVEPAVADEITGSKWNKYVFRTARSSMQDALAAASTLKNGSVAFLAQDYAFGHDAIKAGKEALAATSSHAKVVHEEYAPATSTDFTAPTQRLFDALKDKPQPRILSIVWAGPNPLNKIAEMKPERYGIVLAPGGNILPVMKTWKNYAGTEGTIYYYYGFPKNKMNDWLVAEHMKRFHAPPDMFTAGGMAAASAVVAALQKVPSGNGDQLVTAMEGMRFETPKGPMTFRKEDHQALQSMYHFRIKKDQKNEWDLLELVREIPPADMPLPLTNKR
jgi:branched-chain amino acid transport system substrate-binding protein